MSLDRLQQSCYLDKNHKPTFILMQNRRKDMTSSQFVVITSVLSKLAAFYTELSNHCMLQFANPQQSSKGQGQANLKETATTLIQPKMPQHDNHSHSFSSSPEQKQPSAQAASKKKGRPRKQPVPKIKASTSYYLFFQENKQKVAAKYNITNMKDLATMISKEWKCLPQAERAKYQLRAIEEQNRNREIMMESYRKEYEAQPEQQRKKSSEQDDPKPLQLSPKSGPIPYQTSLSSSSASSSSSSSSSSSKPQRLNKAQVIFIQDSSQTSSKKDDSLQL